MTIMTMSIELESMWTWLMAYMCSATARHRPRHPQTMEEIIAGNDLRERLAVFMVRDVCNKYIKYLNSISP